MLDQTFWENMEQKNSFFQGKFQGKWKNWKKGSIKIHRIKEDLLTHLSLIIAFYQVK